VDGACRLAALLHFGRIAYIDHEDVALGDQFLRLLRGDPGHNGIGGFH
jgi:hypothetical protein